MNINKNNVYVKNAKEIKNIATTEGVDVGVALDMYCVRHSIKYTPHDEEQVEFLDACRRYTLDAVAEI